MCVGVSFSMVSGKLFLFELGKVYFIAHITITINCRKKRIYITITYRSELLEMYGNLNINHKNTY